MARHTPRVTLGGIVLAGASAYDWSVTSGVTANQVFWTVNLETAKLFEGKLGQPQELVINGPRKTLTFQKLYPLEILPGSKPYLRRLRVADLRWRWPYEWLSARFNVRRLTGEKFLVNDQGTPENAITEPVLLYEATTLSPFGSAPGSNAWKATEILHHLLASPPPDGLGETVSMLLTGSGVEVQDLLIDDPAPAAIERVFTYLSGVDLYPDAAGVVVVYDTRSDQGERIAKRTRKGRLATGPESIEVGRAAVRPSKIISLFTPDAECRFDFEEAASSGSTGESLRVDNNVLFNVCPVTDQKLTVAGATLARGSYAELQALFVAWGAFGLPPAQITLEILRKRFLEHGHARFETYFSFLAGGTPDPVGAQRARAVVQSWRRLYRIAPTFFGRLESMAPVRAAILNPETGTRAPSAVYSDYIRRPSLGGLIRNGTRVALGTAVQGHAGGTITSSTHVAPADVILADSGVGVIAIVPQLDPVGDYDEIILGYAENGLIPMRDGLGEANRTLESGYVNWGNVKLRAQYFLSVILSVTPATPQNRTRFYAISVDVPDGKGPPLYSRIFPGIVTARFAWDDNRKDEILNAIKGAAPWDGLSDLLVNKDQLDAVAEANKQRILDTFRDRTFGGHDVDLDPAIVPQGTLGSVRHIMARGVTATQLRWEGDVRQVDIWRYLRADVRRALLRISHARGQSVVGP